MNEIEVYNNPTGLTPRDLGEAMTLSKALARSSIVPSALRGKEGDILAIMLYGMELGIPIMQAMRGINVIKGRPALSTEVRVSKVRERGHRVGVVCVDCGQWADAAVHQGTGHAGSHRYNADWTKERCTVKAVRQDSGETSVITWTIEDAVAAGLLWPAPKGHPDEGKLIARSGEKQEVLPWEAYTKDMLYNRAADRACKQIAPEVAYGLYTREEIEQMPDEPVRVTAEAGAPLTAQELFADAGQPVEPASEPAPADAPEAYRPDTEASANQMEEVRPAERGQLNRMFALFGESGYAGKANRDNRLSIVRRIIGREVGTSNDLSYDEAETVNAALVERIRTKQRAGSDGDA